MQPAPPLTDLQNSENNLLVTAVNDGKNRNARGTRCIEHPAVQGVSFAGCLAAIEPMKTEVSGLGCKVVLGNLRQLGKILRMVNGQFGHHLTVDSNLCIFQSLD